MKPSIKYTIPEDEKTAIVCEPAVAYSYEYPTVEEFVDSLPTESIQQLVDFAIDEYEAGHCIPHSQVKAEINQLMGWN